jgi:hypothetical protein
MTEIEHLQRLAGISSVCLQEYRGPGSIESQGSNCSVTANEKIKYQNTHKIQPGTREWFQLWFSKPYLTGEKPW